MRSKIQLLILWVLACLSLHVHAQTLEDSLKSIQSRVSDLNRQKALLDKESERLKLAAIRRDLKEIGLPITLSGNEVIWHEAMALEYAEPYEQSRWVAHIILSDVTTGTVFRSNDFRPDTCVSSGSSVEADYFLKELQPDSSYKYDGFGYDRGHLAPSADFRWSALALSESYFYSNMSPQSPAFNRESWAAIEDKVRGYLYNHPGNQVYVVTGPVLKEDLPRVERGVHRVAIPEFYYKVALDPIAGKAIGFIMPNQAVTEPLENFAVSIDSVEALTGLDFFNKLPAELQSRLEKQRNLADWFPAFARGDVEPYPVNKLKSSQINTIIAKQWINSNKQARVVGRVVGARESRAGNILLNLDKQFPNQIFTVFIRKESIANFAYDLVEFLNGKLIEIKGKIIGLDGFPAIFIEDETSIIELEKQIQYL